jgi:hypothetical protein
MDEFLKELSLSNQNHGTGSSFTAQFMLYPSLDIRLRLRGNHPVDKTLNKTATSISDPIVLGPFIVLKVCL